ncbi:MAG: NADH-quinone oxidoreductase subunit N [Candidatus Omnitrophica bacterium]|nr:NADH-quinone oxidoreductase subunit N [Candidatus Omnitrophota bacterium]
MMGLQFLSLEGLLLGLIVAVFVADLASRPDHKDLVAQFTLAGLGVLLVVALFFTRSFGAAFSGMFVLDAYALFFKGLFIVIAASVLVMAREFLKPLSRHQGEFYLLILCTLMGMMLLASAHDFILLFVALELMTISFYVMTAYLKTDARSVEAGIKYLILGSLSSGMMVYGISFIYGFGASTNFGVLREAILQNPAGSPLLLVGIVLLLAGIGFKIGSVPFHLWIPDVYEGAPVPVTAFLSVGSKLAAFSILIRVFAEVIAPIGKPWAVLLAVLSALTLLYGNLGAIPQTNIKRFLGYSSIGHAGYLLMGLAAGGRAGSEAVVYYLLAYGITALAVFFVVVYCSVHLGSEEMEDYDGLSQRSPFLAASLFLGLLSLAGVPPLGGFFAKFLVFASVIDRGMVWLAVLGALNVVISLYYYLNLVKRMYIHPPRLDMPIPVSRPFQAALCAAMIGMVAVGLVQGPFVKLVSGAVLSIF